MILSYLNRVGVFHFIFLVALVCLTSAPALGQRTATISGRVTLGDSNQPIHNVLVTILQLKRTTNSDEDGRYSFQGVPAGKYDVVAHLDRVPDTVKSITVTENSNTVLDFEIKLAGVREEVTVTATGAEQALSNSVQSVEVIGSVELAKKNPVSLGESLDGQLGVSKRSFGPATSRPVIRGFDGDRVLVLQDGGRIGGLGFQSGDHAEPIDVLNVERVEIVKGPATLLYGSNAIGGVVNAITGHDNAHRGINGYLTGLGATNGDHAGGSAGLEAGTERVLFWASGGAQRSGDYESPLGPVANSFSRERNVATGVGYYPNHGFLSVNYNYDKRRYGIPIDPAESDPEVVFLDPRRHSVEFRGGFREGRSFLEGGTFSLQYNHYSHSEIDAETSQPNTQFTNKSFIYNAIFDQQKRGRWSGRFGIWGSHRNFEAVGDEALAPPTTHDAFALFGLQSLEWDRVALQFGGRLETNRYDPKESLQHGVLPKRSFTGLSGAVGARLSTWEGGAVTANFTHSYRAPSLEELYNNGPHPGNLAFEIGDPALGRELGHGIDLGLRHSSERLRFETNAFYYNIRDFVFLAPTGGIQDDLIVAEYRQGNTSYVGTEARFEGRLHPAIWFTSGADYVRAELTSGGIPLPRIPPLRARVGLELRFKGLLLNPELIMAKDQDRLFPNETRTEGYAVVGLSGSYLIAKGHTAHIISFNAFNLGDRLYRNHLSFIKNFAPEPGRGLRVAYTLRFF